MIGRGATIAASRFSRTSRMRPKRLHDVSSAYISERERFHPIAVLFNPYEGFSERPTNARIDAMDNARAMVVSCIYYVMRQMQQIPSQAQTQAPPLESVCLKQSTRKAHIRHGRDAHAI